MIFDYSMVDVFICLGCQKLQARRKWLSYAEGESMPHCSCRGMPVKMGYICTVPKSTFYQRKDQAERNWRAFQNNLNMGKHRQNSKYKPEAVRAAYELGVA